ncbi:general secretion pathway protein I [Methylomarinovum tepidoasis]|uniref:General secretion pathway protein I n=1 Tax=Methylomarinovum tepidoasis TaxID=2840183 RepID=A0AAU9D3I2_9GAMM|nr:type II secretion system protein [Methylomarinovum sp. IN45]BCX89544.1 general secretion pathway protein I [Methylomarinovum sp. IN45]
MKRQRGFTLLEIMVAFTLMALSAAVLLQAFGGGARLLARAETVTRAAALAESQLARVGSEWPLEEGEREGEWQGLHWQVTLTPVSLNQLDPQVGENVEEIGNQRLWQVTIVVGWQEGGRGRRYRLTTLRLAPAS